jgi:REP element-mobilizing transposase RayT
MPRGPRIDAPGAVQHLMIRGIERRAIFADDLDREDLAARLARILPESDCRCFAWAFMPNHVHLVTRTGSISVSRVMARVATGYARRFNERHARVGHLFQNRFRSRLVRDDTDLLGLIRYVHLNPVVGGILDDISDLERYPWTGHAALSGRARALGFHAASEALALVDPDPRRARRNLRAFMEVGLYEPEADSLEPDARTWDEAPNVDPVDAPNADSLRRLVSRVCRHFGITPSALHGVSRAQPIPRARALLAHLAVRHLGSSLVELAAWVGMSEGALSRAVDRGAAIARDPVLMPLLTRVEQECPQGKKGNNVPSYE